MYPDDLPVIHDLVERLRYIGRGPNSRRVEPIQLAGLAGATLATLEVARKLPALHEAVPSLRNTMTALRRLVIGEWNYRDRSVLQDAEIAVKKIEGVYQQPACASVMIMLEQLRHLSDGRRGRKGDDNYVLARALELLSGEDVVITASDGVEDYIRAQKRPKAHVRHTADSIAQGIASAIEDEAGGYGHAPWAAKAAEDIVASVSRSRSIVSRYIGAAGVPDSGPSPFDYGKFLERGGVDFRGAFAAAVRNELVARKIRNPAQVAERLIDNLAAANGAAVRTLRDAMARNLSISKLDASLQLARHLVETSLALEEFKRIDRDTYYGGASNDWPRVPGFSARTTRVFDRDATQDRPERANGRHRRARW